MKASEAPEKLYFGEKDETGLKAYSRRESEGDIEYTRTDAFIEKACEWLNNFYSEDRHCYLVAEDIKAFKQAMEE